ncbi:MAG: DNA adenine methylase [Armatimonadota bacterium]
MVGQLAFFDQTEVVSPVNVASVPQRSPFRYPGGKTWLVPRIRKWLRSRHCIPAVLVEPFAGGGIVSLTVAFERLCGRVLMVEIDPQIAAVWQTLLSYDALWLAEQIASFDVNPASVKDVVSRETAELRQLAFQTLLRNRVNHGGILAPGSGFIKRGENGKGLRSRWYPQTLKRRILNIYAVREHIEFIQADGIEVMATNSHRDDSVFFIDPPYTAGGKKAGSRLYSFNELDHEKLFETTSKLAGDFLMTYDNSEDVKQLARRYGFDTEPIPMKNTHHAQMNELLVGRDLDWTRH